MIPDIIRPYLEHPLVKNIENKRPSDLETLDTPLLNNVIRSEDQIIRCVREYSLDLSNRGRLSPGQFSSSILIARGLAFLDISHYKSNVLDIYNDIWAITPTTAKRPSFNRNISTSIIPRLETGGLIEFDSQKKLVLNYIPYAVGSKLFVQKNLIENAKLFEEQANHYEIIGGVQDFPELTSALAANAPQRHNFGRDYVALIEIDAIRRHEIRGREFTFSRSFLTGDQSMEAWSQVLEAADNVRIALRSLMVLQGEYGGFISTPEIVEATGWKPRAVNQLMRHINTLGISRRVRTLDMEDALSRVTSGTLLNMNYLELNNAESILVLIRHVPEAVDMLNLLVNNKELIEDDLVDKYESAVPVQKTRNSLVSIGLIKQDRIYEGVWELTPNRGNDKFILDVLAVCANSRHVLPPNYDIPNIYSDQFKKIGPDDVQKEVKQMKLDFLGIIGNEYKK